MSYSRWGPSNWYAFHNCNSGDTRESQVLSLWFAARSKAPTRALEHTYDTLVHIGTELLSDIYPEASDDDIAEALEIIAAFRADVEEEYNA